MKSLKNLNLKFRYRSGRDDLVEDFFIPTLGVATLYQRAAGFFSASALISLSRGIQELLNNNGSMQLIVSPILSLDDITAIQEGYDKREIIKKNCLLEIERINKMDYSSGVEALAWLIAIGRLDIRIALPHSSGLYHEKMGVITDANGYYVTFSGSINESETAFEINYESFDVDFSWNDVKGVAHEKQIEFINLWNNESDGIDVLEFPEALKKSLLQLRKHSSVKGFLDSIDQQNKTELRELTTIEYNTIPAFPNTLKLRSYQKDAIRGWFSNNCRGIYKMATGTGKTITALASVVKFIEWHQKNKKNGTVIIVVCPYKHLITQWKAECLKFNITPVCCYDSRDSWLYVAQSSVLAANVGSLKYVLFLVTNATFALAPFQHLISQVNTDILFIVDEVHNIGAERSVKLLPEHAQYRLALSATPERCYDEDGTNKLFDYFGDIVIEFPLKKAIENNFLTEYYYYPHFIEFTESEAFEYIDLSKSLLPLLARKMNGEKLTKQEESMLTKILIKRARLCGAAYNKTEKLFRLMQDLKKESHILIYCGDGRVESESDYSDGIRQLDLVIKKIGNEIGMHIHPFTAYESLEERKSLIDRFKDGELQVLAAIRCLDEGVDIPAIKTAFLLASSTNPKQFIQRRGRLLRRYPGKDFSVIHDFIMLPPGHMEQYGANYSIERSLLRKELNRVNEFAGLAINGPEAVGKLRLLKEKYHLMDM